jgi:hypothetical protein
MKKNIFEMVLFVTLLATIALYGCSSSTGPAYQLNAPLINGVFVADYNEIYWPEVAGADYYVVYGLQFKYDPKKDLDESIPKNPKKFNPIVTTTELSYRHQTMFDWAYAVRAFSDDGKESDFSGIEFTEYWAE